MSAVNLRYVVSIFIISLIVNWPIFFSDLLVNDDLTIITAKLSEHYEGLRAAYFDQAKPSGYYLHRFLAWFSWGGKSFYLVLNFICIGISATLLMVIARDAWSMNRNTAFFIAVGLLCFPAFGIQPFAIASLKFVANVTLFAGIYLAFLYWRGYFRWPALVLACLCIAESALHPSSIPFLYAFLASFLILELQKRWQTTTLPTFSLIKGFWICVAITVTVVMVFFAEKLLFKQHDFFSGSYNQIKVAPLILINGSIAGIQASFITQFEKLFSASGLRLSVIATVAALLIMITVRWRKTSSQMTTTAEQPRYWFLFFMVLVFLALAVFPYAAVGKIPASEGYQTRWASYMGVGGGLFIGLLYELSRGARWPFLRESFLGLTLFVVIGLGTIVWDHYGKWHRVAIENNATIAALKTLPFDESIDFYCVKNNLASEGFYYRRWYDWAYIFSQSWPSQGKTMGSNDEYCHRMHFYQQGTLPEKLSVETVILADLHGMQGLVQWMYFGAALSEYRLGFLQIDIQDTRLDRLSGTQVVFESFKHAWFSSEIIDGYRDSINVSY